MQWINTFIVSTLKGFLIVFGLATLGLGLVAYNTNLASRLIFFGMLEYTPVSSVAIRHWGFMVFGIGVLMVVSAFRPWLRYSTMVFSAAEKAFMVFLFLSSVEQPWARAYTIPFLTDCAIVLYSIIYFLSRYGRPNKWIQAADTP